MGRASTSAEIDIRATHADCGGARSGSYLWPQYKGDAPIASAGY